MKNGDRPIGGKIQSTTNNENQIFEVFTDEQNIGLTKREYFAGLAMQGLLSNPDWMKIYQNEKYLMESRIIVLVSINTADALLKELAKNE